MLAKTPPHPNLEINENRELQSVVWRVERAGWVAMGVVIAAALIGLLGSGCISRAIAGGSDFQVEYDRFVHYNSPANIRLTFRAPPSAETADIWIDEEYVRASPVSRISPQPQSVASDGKRQIYRFRLASPGEPVDVYLSMNTRHLLTREGRMGLVHGPEAAFWQFAFP